MTLAGAIAQAQEVLPDHYRHPSSIAVAAPQGPTDHIDPFSGALSVQHTDLILPGNGGFDLQVVRSYSSASIDPANPGLADATAGMGWTLHWGRILKARDTFVCVNQNASSIADNPVLELPDGSRQWMAFTGNTTAPLMSPQRWRATCANTSAGGLIVHAPNGTRYDMTQLVNVGSFNTPVYAWYATQITDRNGNTATLTYAGTGSPELRRISTNDGRSITFTYEDSGASSRRVSSVTAAGQTVRYAYQPVPGLTGKYFLSTVTRADGTQWRYAYLGNQGTQAGSYLMNELGHPEGGTVRYTYALVTFDAQGNPASRTSAVVQRLSSDGGQWAYQYAPGGPGRYDTTTVQSPRGTQVYEHIGPNFANAGSVWKVGLRTSERTADLQTITYAWDKQKIGPENYFRPGAFVGRVDLGETNAPVLIERTIVRDGASYITRYSQFDAYGNPGTTTESGPANGQRTTQRTYYNNTNAWIVQQVQNESHAGMSVRRMFDSRGNTTEITRDGIPTRHTYDAQGNLTSTTHPRQQTFQYSDHFRGVAQREQQPEGITITRTVNDAGKVTSETNGRFLRTAYEFDAMNRPIAKRPPIHSPTDTRYTANSQSTTRGALVEQIQRNGFGHMERITLGGITTTYSLDPLGRRIFESHPGSPQGRQITYDALDRIVRVEHADGSATTVQYGPGSHTETNERGHSTTWTHRGYGHPDDIHVVRIAPPDTSRTLQITRNARDQILTASQGSVTRSYQYNAQFQLIAAQHPESGTTLFGRDEAGNMVSRSQANGNNSQYTYDGHNRLVRVSHSGGAPAIQHVYSATHKLLNSTSSDGNRSYTYDANDNLVSEALEVDGYRLQAQYGYNPLDQLASMTYPQSGTLVQYAPDALGRPTQVSGFITAISYWPSGQVQQLQYANGVTTRYGQNTRLWPGSLQTGRNGSAGYINRVYSYDGTGNLTRIQDSIDANQNRSLGYDSLDQITQLTAPFGSSNYRYDATGNMTRQTLDHLFIDYQYDGLNRLSGTQGVIAEQRSHDAAGQLIQVGTTTYQYDGVPNLRCAHCQNPAQKVEYRYDAANHRSVITRNTRKTYEMTNTQGRTLVEFTPGQPLVEHIYLGHQRIAQRVSP